MADDGPEGTDSADTDEPPADGRQTGTDVDEVQDRMTTAIRVIRREGYKAAVIEASVYAAAAFLGANFVLTVGGVGVSARISVPAIGPLPDGTLPGAAVVGGAIGSAVLVVGLWLRLRRPMIEQFEAVNPAVAEALRTARDTVDEGVDSRMAARLYGDVLDRLRSTSSVGLVNVRRVAGALLVVLALSVLTTQVVVLDIGLGGGDDAGSGTTPDTDVPDYTGLQDGDAVLGDAEDVSAGDNNLTARLESTGGDDQVDGAEQFPSTGGGAGGGGSTIDAQQAGFDQPERLEDAELIREYNLRIREETERP
jgi:hypothetical protein